jgi:hypothetical protein
MVIHEAGHFPIMSETNFEIWKFIEYSRYKPEGRGFETRWGEWFLSSYLILLVSLGPGVYSDSNRNEYQMHKKNVSGE